MPTFPFTVPSGFSSTANALGFPQGPLNAVTEAFGRLMETMIGRPTTSIYQDFQISDVTMFVDTTLAFPDSGKFWAEKYLITYTGKTAGSFTGCTSRARSRVLGASLVVTLHTPSVPPT